MTGLSFGKLERVEARIAWANEAGDFTPWLAQSENLRLLGDTIGIELELEAQEKSVGPFRADILCKDTVSDNWVLIENQLGRTDHTHLGQLLTYAAGLQAVTIVWIAHPFTEEHRAALDWLNQITDTHFNFFGLEIELWKIGDSPIAPKFNVVCKPNDWSKTVAQSAARVETAAMTETQQLQLDFWTAFKDYVLERGSQLKPTKPAPQNWMSFAIGKSGCHLAAIASKWDSHAESWDKNELRAEVNTVGKYSKHYFSQLHLQKDEIETELNEQLAWYNPETAQICRIYTRKTVNLADKNDWPRQHQWLLEQLEELHRVFTPHIQKLSARENEE